MWIVQENSYDTIIVCVRHDQFLELGTDKIHQLGKRDHVLYDVKHLFDKGQVDGGL